MKIIKSNGSETTFSKSNIINAISKANMRVRLEDRFTPDEIKKIAKDVEDHCKSEIRMMTSNDIQNLVEHAIMEAGKYDVAVAYITYRYQKQMDQKKNTTDEKIISLLDDSNEELKQENSNKNPTVINVQRDYMAGEVSKDLCERYLVPSDIWKAHKEGIIHFHDSDYFANREHNCDLWNAKDMLENGTVLCGVKIDRPHRFSVACTIASQIAQQISSSQYGGQSLYASHLSPFVEESRNFWRNEFPKMGIDPTEDNIEKATIRDIEDGIQTLMYQLNSLQGTNGQAPFITIFMYLDDVPEGKSRDDLALVCQKIFEQRILGLKDKNGVYVSPAFPKLIYVLDEDNIHDDSPYFWLTELAAKCTANRMVPDYISAKVMKELKDGNVYSSMGCRSFLTVAYVDKNDPWKITTKKRGVPKFVGRFNQGVVTLNLPDVALSSGKDIEKFWYILDERLELCHRALRLRHERLRGVKSDTAPILWQNGAIARLKPGETIDKLLYNGYSTISLGYVGLYETVKYLTGKNHWETEDEGGAFEFAVQIMQRLNDKCKQWKEIENIDYSVYATPEESTTYKFARSLQTRFGKIKGITDKNFVTNSYHIPVWIEMDAFEKLSREAQLQKLSPGGAISYIEAPNMTNNIPAIITLLRHMYDTIMYAEINLKLDTCGACGYQGAFDIKEIDGKLQFVCPECGETEFAHTPTKLRPCRRVCGYISTNQMNQGRMADIEGRVEHI